MKTIILKSFFYLIISMMLLSCQSQGERFKNQVVNLPLEVVKVENGDVYYHQELPKDDYRLVFFYGRPECFDCVVFHAYDMCNLFSSTNYSTIILISPPFNQMDSVIDRAIEMRYDFPLYITYGNNWEKGSHIPISADYHVFVLNDKNMPIFVGDPVRDDLAAEEFNKLFD